MKKKQKSLIILWMSGGPTTIDLWDMKPGTPNGGEHRPKATAAGAMWQAGKLTDSFDTEGGVFADFHLGAAYEGPPGHVHGGVAAP